MAETYVRFKTDKINLGAFDSASFEKHLKDLSKDELNEQELLQELFNFSYDQLSEATNKGFGQPEYNTEDILLNRELLSNIAVFSAFKSYRQLGDLQTSVIDSNGNRKPFDVFRKDAQAIDEDYNETWLRAEYNLAMRQAASAKQWNGFIKDRDLYPNLQYMPSVSPDPREIHKKYYGIIKPIDDAFWNTSMPPNGFGCKCGVSNTDEEPTVDEVGPVPLTPGIEGNAGKSRRVFPPTHPYVTSLSQVEKNALQGNLSRLWRNAPTDAYITQTIGKGKISLHPASDEADLELNLDYGSKMVGSLGGELKILKHSEEIGVKNPEYNYNGTIGDRTKMSGTNIERYIKNSFNDKYKKSGQLAGFNKSFLALDFDGKLTNENLFPLVKRLNGDWNQRTKTAFIIMRNNDKFVLIKRGTEFGEILEQIKKELL